MKACPHCSHAVNSTAIVDAFNEPDAWQFWGTAGQRWIVCRDAGYVHFRVKVGRRDQHRLAIIRGQAQEWLNAERAAAEINASRNHVDTPDRDYYAKQDNWLGDEI